MDDINTVYALLVLIMFFVLLSRLDNRFGKIERELNEIKKRMDDYLKVQQRGVTEKVKPEGEALKKENEARRRYAGVSTRRIAYLNDTSPFTATYPRDEVFPLRPLEFEGRQVYFPNKLEKHLSTLYGDFMPLPPVEKRKNHYPARLDFGPYADLPRCSPRS